MNSKLNLAPRVDSETETDSSKYVAKEYNRCTDKVKNTLKQEIYHFYFHLTHILEISRFEVPISRFFWAFFQHLQICMFWRLAGLNYVLLKNVHSPCFQQIHARLNGGSDFTYSHSSLAGSQKHALILKGFVLNLAYMYITCRSHL